MTSTQGPPGAVSFISYDIIIPGIPGVLVWVTVCLTYICHNKPQYYVGFGWCLDQPLGS